jgi:protein-S-isoprenylcysteine O-methyltransferase Ste14
MTMRPALRFAASRAFVARVAVAAGPVLYFGWLVAAQVRADWPLLVEPRLDLEMALSLAAIGYLLILLGSYWAKPPALVERRDVRAVVATVLAIDAFGLSAIQPVTRPDAGPLAVGLMLVGTLLAAWAALALGRSFSLLPQARTLVTRGPYRYVRHPIYLGGLLITAGEIALRWSPLVLALNAVFVAAQIVRLRYEEALLERAFPEYAEYRRRTSALIPGIA